MGANTQLTRLKKKAKSKAEKLDIDLPSGNDIKAGGQGLLFGSLSILVGLGAVWGFKKYVSVSLEENRYEKALIQAGIYGTPEYQADRLYSAIQGSGSDWDEILSVYNGISTKREYRKIYEAYNILSDGDDLNRDLKAQWFIFDSDFKKLQQIIASKPQ